MLQFLSSDLSEVLSNLAIVFTEVLVSLGESVGEQLCEEKIDRLQVSQHAVLHDLPEKAPKAENLDLARVNVFVGQFLVHVLLAQRDRKD